MYRPSFGRGLRIKSSFEEDGSMPSPTRMVVDSVQPGVHTMAIEPPPWAVRASGEARLEPVGLTLSTHDPIDLSSNECYQVGRSPSSDMRLFHPTSSRNHALLFHHPNGSCYVVDCGSSHGTFVNGARVENPTIQGGGEKATAVPSRVRKGALIRFGGPEAPTFVLKSFSTSLECLVQTLSEETVKKSGDCASIPACQGAYSPVSADKPTKGVCPSFLPTLSPTAPRPSSPSPEALAKTETNHCSPSTALVALNTRVNALGGGALLSNRNRLVVQKAASKFVRSIEELEQIDFCLLGKCFSYTSNPGYDSVRLGYSRYPLSNRPRLATFPFSPMTTVRSCMKVHEVQSPIMQAPLLCQQFLIESEVDLLGKNEKCFRVKFNEDKQKFYCLVPRKRRRA